MTDFETLETKIRISLMNAKQEVREMISELGGLQGTLSKTGQAFSTVKKALGIGATVKTIQNASKSYSELYYSAVKMKTLMGELQNAYDNNTMQTYYQKAINFQSEMNDKLAIAKSELQEYQSMFYKMYESQGVSKEVSYNLSENLTKMGYDLSQVYFGGDTSSAMSALKSGISGQVKTLRKYGIDVSESSLNSTLQTLGVERTTEQLNYAEKELVRYIAIMNQAKDAQGAFAKSINSPVVQLQMLKASFTELKQTIGSFIMGAFGKIVPYLMAIVQVIKQVLKSIADIFGFSIDIGTVDIGASTGINDLSDNLDNATASAKQFKKQLLGFDEINNITPQTTSGSSSGGATGGIDSNILKGLKDWDNMLDSIKDKASDIKEKIWNWFKFDDKIQWVKDHFDAILGLVKDIAMALLLWKVSTALTKFFATLAGMSQAGIAQTALGIGLTVTGLYLMYKGIKKLINGDFDIVNVFEAIGGGAMAGFGLTAIVAKAMNGGTINLKSAMIGFGIVATISGLIFAYNGIKKLINSDMTLGTLMETCLGTAGGTLGITSILKNLSIGKDISLGKSLGISFGITLMVESITSTVSEAIDGFDMKELLGGATSGALGGGAIGAVVGGPFGALLGAGIGSGITQLSGYVAELAGNLGWVKKETEDYTEVVDNSSGVIGNYLIKMSNLSGTFLQTKDSILESAQAKLDDLSAAKEYSETLQDLINDNGRVVGSYEAVDYALGLINQTTGLSIERDGDKIKINGEVVSSYEELRSAIDETIKKTQEEIEQQAYSELYIESLKNKITAQKEYNEQKSKEQQAWAEAKEAMEKYGISSDEYKQKLKQAAEETQNLSVAEETLKGAFYNTAYYAISSGSNISKMLEETGENYETFTKAVADLLKENNENWEKAFDQMNDKQKESFILQNANLATESPKLAQKWAELIENSTGEYKDALGELDLDTLEALNNTIKTVQEKNPDLSSSYEKIGKSASEAFSKKQSEMYEETKKTYEKIYGHTLSQQTTLSNANSEVGKSAVSGYNKEFNSANLIATTNQTYSELKTNIESQDLYSSAKKSGSQIVNGTTAGIDENSYKTTNSIGTFASKIMKKFKETLGIHSPSKAFQDLAEFIPSGIAKGIDLNADEAYSSIKELGKGIQVEAERFGIGDTELYGNIQGQSNVTMETKISSNIIYGIAEAVKDAMKNAELNVNIEAKADEGVIVKKASEGFKDYVMRTGELPFPVPV